jgi:hypothetical protein
MVGTGVANVACTEISVPVRILLLLGKQLNVTNKPKCFSSIFLAIIELKPKLHASQNFYKFDRVLAEGPQGEDLKRLVEHFDDVFRLRSIPEVRWLKECCNLRKRVMLNINAPQLGPSCSSI